MSKRTTPLLYIYQRKEADVEAISQEFVYKKFKIHVEAKHSDEKREYPLASETEYMSIVEKLEYLISSPTKQEVKIEIKDEIYNGYVKEITSKQIIVLTDGERVQLNIDEITAVQIIE